MKLFNFREHPKIHHACFHNAWHSMSQKQQSWDAHNSALFEIHSTERPISCTQLTLPRKNTPLKQCFHVFLCQNKIDSPNGFVEYFLPSVHHHWYKIWNSKSHFAQAAVKPQWHEETRDYRSIAAYASCLNIPALLIISFSISSICYFLVYFNSCFIKSILQFYSPVYPFQPDSVYILFFPICLLFSLIEER